MTPFARIASVASLTEAFDKTLRNGGSAGGDGETLYTFARNAETRIARLSYELEAGFYRPGPLRRVAIPKKGGGTRTLAIPSIVDRVVQGSAAAVLSDLLDPHFEISSFGYRPGRSVKQAVARVAALRRQGYGFVVGGDIRAFFDEVPHGPLLDKLGRLVPDPRVTALVGLWLESFSRTGRGLAQGAPVSPVLSNLYLDAVDEHFIDGPVRLVRFADDFVLLAKTRKNADRALDRIAHLLAEEGLALNPDKTRIVPLDTAFNFLGHLFIRSMVLEAGEEEEERGRIPLGPANLATPPAPEEASVMVLDAPPEPPPSSDGSNGGAEIVARREPDPLADLPDRDPDDFAAGLAPLYLLEAGRRLSAERETLVVSEHGHRQLAVPAKMVGRIDLGPEVEADDMALRLAAAHRIPVAFLDGLGQPEALLTPPAGADAGLHLAQARLMVDEARALELARVLVAARLRNQHALLKRLNRRRKLEEVEMACHALRRTRRRAAFADTIDAARGYEGEGGRLYWPALGACLEHGAGLRRRRDEGGRNPVNAVLDFTASLLTRDMRAAVLRAGLHPGFGVLHVTDDRREACVWDMVEPFRAPLAEGLTVYLFNNRIVGTDGHASTGSGLRLSSGAARRVVETFEAWMARPVKNARTGRSTTWRNLLLAECRAFAAAMRRDEPFAPFELDF